MTATVSIHVDDRRLDVRVSRRRTEAPGAPRLVVVSWQPNELASQLLRLCLASIRCHTPEPHELWVVDNGSPAAWSAWLDDEGDVNVIRMGAPPRPSGGLLGRLTRRRDYRYHGSYANGFALEAAAQVIDPESHLMMSLHMDTMACRAGWLSELRRHLSDRTRAVGVRLDMVRVRTLHVLGMMFDFTLYRELGLSFRHNMPHYDAGDGISIGLADAGYELWACPNTLHDPALVNRLDVDSPYRRLRADRSLDEDGRVLFMHLGRGVVKATGPTPPGKTSVEEWLRFGREIVLRS